MGDCFETLVDVDVAPDDAPRQAERLRELLVSRSIIREIRTPCVLGGDGRGYPPGASYAAACANPNETTMQMVTNGVEIAAERTVAIAAHADPLLECPRCASLRPAGDEFWSAISAWYDGDLNVALLCPDCLQAAPLRRWRGDPPFAVGHAAATFWNWPPLSPRFIEEINAFLGHQVVRVSGKL